GVDELADLHPAIEDGDPAALDAQGHRGDPSTGQRHVARVVELPEHRDALVGVGDQLDPVVADLRRVTAGRRRVAVPEPDAATAVGPGALDVDLHAQIGERVDAGPAPAS